MPKTRSARPFPPRAAPEPTPAEAAASEARINFILERLNARADADEAWRREHGLPDPPPEKGDAAIAFLSAEMVRLRAERAAEAATARKRSPSRTRDRRPG